MQWRRVFRRAWNYVRKNWAQTVAISFATAMLVYGVLCTISAIRTAVANKQLANSVIQPADASKDILQFESRIKLEEHFAKHGKEFGGLYQTADEYLTGANYVIKNGIYVSEMNGYLRFFGAGGKANYAFVGLTQSGRNIATFGIRSISKLTKVPWLS